MTGDASKIYPLPPLNIHPKKYERQDGGDSNFPYTLQKGKEKVNDIPDYSHLRHASKHPVSVTCKLAVV